MILHVVHQSGNNREQNLLKEIEQQGITHRIWEVIPMSTPRKSIHASHHQIIRYAKENRLPQVCVAQDDVKFTAPGAYNYFIHSIPQDYDIYLGNTSWSKPTGAIMVRDFAGLFLFVVNERYYDTFLKSDEKKCLDRAQSGRGLFKVCNPSVAITYDGWSYSKNKIVKHERYWKHRKQFLG